MLIWICSPVTSIRSPMSSSACRFSRVRQSRNCSPSPIATKKPKANSPLVTRRSVSCKPSSFDFRLTFWGYSNIMCSCGLRYASIRLSIVDESYVALLTVFLTIGSRDSEGYRQDGPGRGHGKATRVEEQL